MNWSEVCNTSSYFQVKNCLCCYCTGEIISRLTSDTATMSDTIGLNCNVFLRSTLKTLIISGFMISLSWRLTIAIFMGIPIVTAISKGFGFYFKVGT